MPTAKCFVDTNVAIYLLDADATKRAKALAILDSRPFISTQVVNEYLNVLLVRRRLDRAAAHELARALMATGNLSSLSGLGGGDTRYLQITAPVQPGNSGGPMLDSAGNLMGVVVSKLDAIRLAKITGDIAQNVNFAINVNVLRAFLDANSVDYHSASSDKPLAPTAIAEKARGLYRSGGVLEVSFDKQRSLLP